jgi:hypothetical protein
MADHPVGLPSIASQSSGRLPPRNSQHSSPRSLPLGWALPQQSCRRTTMFLLSQRDERYGSSFIHRLYSVPETIYCHFGSVGSVIRFFCQNSHSLVVNLAVLASFVIFSWDTRASTAIFAVLASFCSFSTPEDCPEFTPSIPPWLRSLGFSIEDRPRSGAGTCSPWLRSLGFSTDPVTWS